MYWFTGKPILQKVDSWSVLSKFLVFWVVKQALPCFEQRPLSLCTHAMVLRVENCGSFVPHTNSKPVIARALSQDT